MFLVNDFSVANCIVTCGNFVLFYRLPDLAKSRMRDFLIPKVFTFYLVCLLLGVGYVVVILGIMKSVQRIAGRW